MIWLAGYRTYLVAAAMAALAAAYGLGWIDRSTYEMLLGLLTGAGMATIRSGVKNDTKV